MDANALQSPWTERGQPAAVDGRVAASSARALLWAGGASWVLWSSRSTHPDPLSLLLRFTSPVVPTGTQRPDVHSHRAAPLPASSTMSAVSVHVALARRIPPVTVFTRKRHGH